MDLADSQIGLKQNSGDRRLIDNRYEVVEMLEQSENQALFLVNDLCLENEEVLLKVFHVSKSTTARDFSRFKNELIVARRLSHPNIGRVYDIGKIDSNDYYITIEKHSGISLAEMLEKNSGKVLDVNFALDIIYRIALALNEAHSHGVVHRGISAQNIVISNAKNSLKEVYLNGFGNGKVLGENFGLTKTGEIIGSPSYMAPEQLRGEEIDNRADIFALGTLTFEILTGRKPYEDLGDSPLVLMRAKQSLPLIRNYRKDAPEWVDAIVAKMLALDKNERYESIKDVIEELLSKSLVRKRRKTKNKKVGQKRSVLFIGLAAVFLTILAFIFVAGSTKYNQISSKNNDTALNKSLIAAVEAGEEAKVFQLLKKGIKVSDLSLENPLICLAANLQNVNVLYTLLNHDQSIVNEQGVDGQSPLVIAVLKRNIDMVELLLNYNANVKLKDVNGKNALDYAKELNEAEIAKMLKNAKN